MKQVGLVGCGALGCLLGGRLLRGGHRLTVHDRDRAHAAPLLEQGAHWADRPSDLGEDADVLLSALPHPEDVESVFMGDVSPWRSAPPRTIHVEVSTVGPDCVRGLAQSAAERGLWLLDAPISRGRIAAQGVEVVTWVGGDTNHYDVARPVLETIADHVVYCGGVGHGQVTKLLNNIISHSLTVMVGEVMAIGVKAGASLELLSAALAHGTGQTRVLDELLPGSVFRGDWRPGLRLDLAVKDLRLAEELADEHGIRPQALDRITGLFETASRRGWGDLSAHAVVRLVEEALGVELRYAALPPGSDETK